MSNPANPLRVGVHEVPGGITAIKAHGGRLYMLDGTGTFKVLDIANPRNVAVLGSYNSWGAGGSGLAVSGSYAWLPLGAAGLQVLDVSNPTNLTWLAGAWINPAEDVALMGKYAVVAAGDRGLVVYELEQSIKPPLRPPVVTGGMMTFTWPALEGVRLQKCTNLVTRYWQDVPSLETTNAVSLPANDPAAFFRLAKGPKAIPPPPGLVALWSGDGNAFDLVGTNHGVMRNGVTWRCWTTWPCRTDADGGRRPPIVSGAAWRASYPPLGECEHEPP